MYGAISSLVAVKLVASAADSTAVVVADRAVVVATFVVILHPIACTDCLVVAAVVAMNLAADTVT